MRDAVRYKRKKITGKSGDSGDETAVETFKSGDDSNDVFAFLTQTSSRYPRDTIKMGAGVDFTTTRSIATSQNSQSDMPEEDDRWPHEYDDESSKSTVYSYVSILFIFHSIFSFQIVQIGLLN